MLSDGSEPIAALNAERAVLAAVLLAPETWWEMVDRVAAADFYDPRHRLVWEAFAALIAAGTPIDLDTVAAELLKHERLNTVGGRQAISAFLDEIPTVAHCGYHATIVRDLARIRAIEQAAREVAAMSRGFGDEADAYAERAVARIAEAAEGPDGGDEACPLADAVDLALSDDEAAVGAPTAHWHIPTLEYLTGGLSPGQLLILGARPGVGKTALALETAIEAAADGGVLVAIMEAPRVEVAQRLLARVSGVELSRWKRPADRQRLATADAGAYAALQAAARDLHTRGIVIADAGRQTVASIYGRARKMKARAPLSLVVVDYLQLLQDPAGMAKGANREQAVAANARALKLMAMELGVPVLALSQLNRAADDARPTLAMLRESGSIEQDANTVIFLYAPSGQAPDAEVKRVMLLLAKQRNGVADVEVELGYTRATTAFHEVDASERTAFTPKRAPRGKGRDGARDSGTHYAPSRPGPVATHGDGLDAYGAGDGLPGVGAPEPLFDDLGPQDEAGAA